MSNNVISLSSSDEEDSVEPATKRCRIAAESLPECSVTLVTNNTNSSKSKTSISTTVTLDSDDESSSNIKATASTEPNTTDAGKTVQNGDVVVTLTDDEDEVQPKIDEINSLIQAIVGAQEVTLIQQNKNGETVSIDDSDTEITPVEVNTDSIVINDSDEETEKENHCENGFIEAFPVSLDKTSASDVLPSTSKAKDETAEARANFKRFLRLIEEKIVDSSFEEILPKKTPILQKYFKRSGIYVNEESFKTVLNEAMDSVKNASNANATSIAIVAFWKVFEHLKFHIAETTVIIEEDDLGKVRKLEKTIKLLRKRIKLLEEAEVNWDDDKDSSYIQLDRYQSRIKKVYAKYCEYLRRNPHSGRVVYDKVTIVNSKYNEINQALSKKYKNSIVFPTYFEMEKYITKVVTKANLNLSEEEIKLEAKTCFEALGSILQKKRRQELYDSHLDYIEFTEDPAAKDTTLESILQKNYSEGKDKIEKLIQMYVNKQEMGEDKVSTEEEPETPDQSDNEVKEEVIETEDCSEEKPKIKENTASEAEEKEQDLSKSEI